MTHLDLPVERVITTLQLGALVLQSDALLEVALDLELLCAELVEGVTEALELLLLVADLLPLTVQRAVTRLSGGRGEVMENFIIGQGYTIARLEPYHEL